MINSEPLSIMTQTVANRNTTGFAPNNYQSSQYNVNPTTRLTIEQLQSQLSQYQQQAAPPLSDPYSEYVMVLGQCSDLVKSRIVNDIRYQQIDNECETLVKQILYSELIPKVLTYQQGRLAFEKLCNTTKQLKQEYSQEEVQITQNMQTLMSDPIVLARLQELQQQSQQNTQTASVKQIKKPKTQSKSNVEEVGDIE